MNQKKLEEQNKQIINEALSQGRNILEFYYTHSEKDTIEHFKLKNKKILRKILSQLNYDSSKKISVLKGKKSSRTHESYVNGGKKSGETQKKNWKNKSQEEKDAWRDFQIESHNTKEYKEMMSSISKEAYLNISEEDKKRMNDARSTALKKWWNSLSEEERQHEIQKHLEGGAGWNHETIRKTIRERYNVSNVSQVPEFNEDKVASMMQTCQERYGINFNCQLPQCKSAIGSKASFTKPNMEFDALLKECPELNYHGEIGIDREINLDKYIYDFKVGNTLIEINPTPTHNSTYNIFDKTPTPKYYHRDKSDNAKKHGYRCIHVWDWDDKSKVINLLLTRETIYARNCKVDKVSRQDAKDFINKYHCQGYARCSILLGLYYKGTLVSIMTFGKPRYSHIADYELIRYCSSRNIIGGAEKLFKHFLDEYKPNTIVSYCDESKFDGKTYTNLGFKLTNTRIPSKHWYNIKTKEHYTDTLLQQQGFSRLINRHDASLDNLSTNNNRQLMIDKGFVEVYDCGQSTYIYIKKLLDIH